MAIQQQRFTVQAAQDYVHLKTWGVLDINDLEAPANAALALAREKHLDKLLDDIREIDTTGVSMRIQTKAMGILWKLRTFRKVAIVLKGSRVKTLLFSTLDILHLNRESKFKGFDNEAEAIAWLQES